MLDFISLYLFFNFSSSLLSLTRHTSRNIPPCPTSAGESRSSPEGGAHAQRAECDGAGVFLLSHENITGAPWVALTFGECCIFALFARSLGWNAWPPVLPPPSLPHPWEMDQQYIELVDPYCVNNSFLTQKCQKEGEQLFIKNNDA